MNGKQLKNIESGRMFKIVEDFVRRFPEIIIKDGAQSHKVIDPLDKKPISIAGLIAHLIPQYVNQTDAVNMIRNDYDNSQNPNDLLMLEKAKSSQLNTVMALFDAITYARTHNLIDDGSEKQLNELRQENNKLREKIKSLSTQLKNCDTELAFYRKYLDKFKGSTEIGDVQE